MFDIKIIYTQSDPVGAVAVSNRSTGTISIGLFPEACQYTKSTNPVQLLDLTDDTGVTGVSFRVLINYTDSNDPKFTDESGTELGCYFTPINAAAGEFRFYIRILDTPGVSSTTDRDYMVESTDTDVENVVFTESVIFLNESSLVTVVTSTAYTFDMAVVGWLQTDITDSSMGETAQLKFTMTANTHEDKMDLSGARLTNCSMSNMRDFSDPVITFIGDDGCIDHVSNIWNVSTDTGFGRDNSSSKVGTFKTYVAFSPKFELSPFAYNLMNSTNGVYFRSDITLCLDDTDSSTAGQCATCFGGASNLARVDDVQGLVASQHILHNFINSMNR